MSADVPQSGTPQTKRKLIEVSAGVIFRRGLLLITQRRPQDHLGGLWEFPGGKRDPDESDEACLHRELLEELDIEVTIHGLIQTLTHEYPGKLVQLKFFHCDWLQREPRALAVHDIAWVRREELVNYTFPEADAQLLQKLQATPEFWIGK
ncbi:MAG TPA: (deoxy)nucleoside triphosphate pyrophosphohydrolase [Verrucomicrobiae bacterium]|jgi:mutator protein MutT|nr:(deoxy)nucleoside triphosphate pyrophosphohydrolase [Verrucomicrobiae bacterium]